MAQRSAVVDSLVQASAGGAAACLTTLFLYPFDVVKTRLNRGTDEDGIPYRGIWEVVERQTRKGVKGFYSGLQVKLVQDILRSTSFFYMFTFLKKAYKRKYGSIGVAANLLLGYFAAAINLVITMPVEVANTRIITGVSKTGLFQTWRDIMAQGGLRALYTGIFANFVLCANPAIKHMIYDQVRARLLKGRRKISGAQAFWLGAGATAVASTITYPFARTRAMLQSTKMSGGAAKEERKRGEVAAMIAIARRKGVTDLYQGLVPHIIKGIFSSAILLAAKEQIYSNTEAIILLAAMLLRRALDATSSRRARLVKSH